MRPRTLLISLQGIGNNLLALPLASALARGDGEPVAMLVRSPRAAPLLALKSCVGEVFVLQDAPYKDSAGRFTLIRRLRKARFRRAVFAYPSGRRSALIALAAGIPRRIGLSHWALGMAAKAFTHSREAVHGRHDLEQNMIIAELAETRIELEKDWPPLRPGMGSIKRAEDFLADSDFPTGPFLGLHPGSDSKFIEKRWPEAHFARLVEEIHRRRKIAAICFDGPAEAGAGKRIAHLAKTPVLAMDGWGDLRDALGMLHFCDLFVSNDSGLMNLAAAAGIPTLGLFGPSLVSRTRPWGEPNRVLSARRSCVPCYDMEVFPGCLHRLCPCMEDIAPSDAARVLMEMIAE